MSAELLPCPFCGAGESQVVPSYYWTGTTNTLISVEVKHWCHHETSGVRGSMVTMRAKTEAEAVVLWNRRGVARRGEG